MNTTIERKYPDQPIVGVGVVVLSPKGVLLIKRSNPPSKGSWSLPGGAQDLGETVFHAGKREVLEETGLKVEITGLIDVVDSIHPDPSGQIKYHYTLVDLIATSNGNPPIAGSDAEDARWFPIVELPNLGLWSETLRIIDKAIKMQA